MENVLTVCGNAVECLGKRNPKNKNFKVAKFGQYGSWRGGRNGINGQSGEKLCWVHRGNEGKQEISDFWSVGTLSVVSLPQTSADKYEMQPIMLALYNC